LASGCLSAGNGTRLVKFHGFVMFFDLSVSLFEVSLYFFPIVEVMEILGYFGASSVWVVPQNTVLTRVLILLSLYLGILVSELSIRHKLILIKLFARTAFSLVPTIGNTGFVQVDLTRGV
jgi:hypothetical protein